MDQTVLGNVVRLMSSLNICYLAMLFVFGAQKCHGTNNL